jgi:hypothetical protein
MGEIEENWEFNDQLRVSLHKPKTDDQNKKDVEIQDWYWNLMRVKLHKIKNFKSIKGAGMTKRNKKPND